MAETPHKIKQASPTKLPSISNHIFKNDFGDGSIYFIDDSEEAEMNGKDFSTQLSQVPDHTKKRIKLPQIIRRVQQRHNNK